MTTTFIQRIEIAREAENKVIGILYWNNKQVCRVGQENWLPEWIHKIIRFKYEKGIEMIKHFPDLSTNKALIQVKCAPESDDYSCVTIESASFDSSKVLSDFGIPVLIIWLLQDKSLFGNWVNDISTQEPDTDREDTGGSHTPYLLVSKSNLHPFRDFLHLL